jgi:4-carboxymuconolactone decarboxylase
MPTNSRIRPLLPAEWTDSARQIFTIVGGAQAQHIVSEIEFFRILAVHPELGIPLVTFTMHLLRASTLSVLIREIAILRTVCLHRSEFQWSAHVKLAQEIGMTMEQIESIQSGANAPIWSDLERSLLRAIDSIATNSQTDEEAWDIVAKHFNRRQLLDLLFTVGNYAMVAMAINTFRVSLAPGMISHGRPRPTTVDLSTRPPSQGNPDLPRTSSPRIPAVPSADWTDKVRDVFAVFEGQVGRERGSKANVTLMLANHPDLSLAFLPFNKHLLRTSALPSRLVELAVLRSNCHRYSEYQWFHHVELAEKSGITLEEIRMIGHAEAGGWLALEKNVLRAVDQLCTFSEIDDATWEGLAAHLNPMQLIDLVFTIGNYAMLAGVFNVAGLVLEPPYDRYRVSAPRPKLVT